MTLRFMTAGESHGPALVAILDGMVAGLPLQAELIDNELKRRQQGYGAGPRMQIEKDRVQILGGLMDGHTTGAPLALLIENADAIRWRGKAIEPMTAPRPGHADLTGAVKYGYTDLRPALERASARETAARVAVGAICKLFLAQFGIQVGGYVISIGEVDAALADLPYAERLARAGQSDVRCPDPVAAGRMHQQIAQVMQARDTLGGLLEIIALNLPPGLGSYAQWDRRLDARLAAAVMSVPAIKGVEIGSAFENARRTGTQVQDAIHLAVPTGYATQASPQGESAQAPTDAGTNQGALVRTTDHAGGTEGGLSNGQPLVIRAAMKPIASTLLPQPTVDLASGVDSHTKYERSDFCPVPRAVPILEAMVAFTLADALLEKLGGDSLAELLPRFASLRRANLEDVPMDNLTHVWWPE
ncbi:MAG TPA: chorismate synthase [Polyangia bacterium]